METMECAEGSPVVLKAGYYRILKDSESSMSRGFQAGNLAYVLPGVEEIVVLIGDSRWTYHCSVNKDMQEFSETFDFEPDGHAIRQNEIANLMQELQETDSVTSSIQSQLSHFNPSVVGDDGDSVETGTDLAPVSDMKSIKLQVANTRNTIAKTKKGILSKTKKLKDLLSEQSRILELKTKELENLLSKAEEAIWSINLYLGRNEEIHILRSGVPAPSDQKIVLRQQVLFMDEECAIAARSQGIDIHSIEQFDAWLLENPAHLNQVLYETKAIVALHVKRLPKNYGDQYTDNTINKANLNWTYFLIRNGENLYRVFIDVNAGAYLFPTTDSMTNLFSGYKPGSKEYMQAIKSAEESHRHYLRILLVLQGLLDRTPIFKPMPVSRINICDPGQSYDYLEFVYDAERQLTDGRPLFDEWLEDMNSQLEVGHRIMGIFDYTSGISGGRDQDSRISPKGASRPDSNVLYTVEKQEDDKFIFLYERIHDTIYTRYGRSHTPKNRASCWVSRDDNFTLDFDSAELKDLEYYATHRQSRHMYKSMIPLLEEAIKLKKKEIEEEQPFRQLLTGQIMRKYQVSLEDAEDAVGELVSWWKFKNRTHRALLSNDTLALDMIVSEYGLRSRNALAGQGLAHMVVDAIKGNSINCGIEPLMIAHKSDNIFVAYIPHNDDNIWVKEQEWKFSKSMGRIDMVGEYLWQTVDKRHWRWEIVYKSDRWKGWRINPVKNRVLTDPEIEHVIEDGIKVMEGRYDKGDRTLPLAVTCNAEFEIDLWFSDRGLVIPQLLHSGRVEGPSLKKLTFNWTKKKGVVSVSKYCGYPSSYCGLGDRSHPWDGRHRQVFRQWDENIQTVRLESLEELDAKKREREIESRYGYVADFVSKQEFDQKVAAAHWEFLEEHGDPELWEDHLRGLRIQKKKYSVVDQALMLWAERGLDPVGKSLGEVFEMARGWGMFEEGRSSWDNSYSIPDELDLNWIIPVSLSVVEKIE